MNETISRDDTVTVAGDGVRGEGETSALISRHRASPFHGGERTAFAHENYGRESTDTESGSGRGSPDESMTLTAPLSKGVVRRLLLSHLLSTWNSRLFEFGAVLFLAAAYPGTLQPASIYALVRGASAVALAPTMGKWIDEGERLFVVRWSILGQRGAVVGSCGLLLALMNSRLKGKGEGVLRVGEGVLFGLVVLLACVEKLASVVNLVAVERDWVAVMTEGNEEGRRELNAQIRRIDLICKLLGPFVIGVVDGFSTVGAIWLTLVMGLVSAGVEYVCIETVYSRIPALHGNGQSQLRADSEEPESSHYESTTSPETPAFSFYMYVRHRAFRPSLALALLYFTVLSFSGQMVVFLRASGYTSPRIATARAVSTAFELGATWAGPRLVRHVGVVRAGIWSLSWQSFWLTVGVACFLGGAAVRGGVGDGTDDLAVGGLVGGVVLSRVGLWAYDLVAQNIIQDEVEPESRGAFSTVEASLQNCFELLSYAGTAVFSRPDQFRWSVFASVVAVYVATAVYASFVHKRRGHLFHVRCLEAKPRVGLS